MRAVICKHQWLSSEFPETINSYIAPLLVVDKNNNNSSNIINTTRNSSFISLWQVLILVTCRSHLRLLVVGSGKGVRGWKAGVGQ